MKAKSLRIGIIGMGNMGLAIAKAIYRGNKIYYHEKKKERIIWLKEKFPVFKYLELNQLIDSSQVILFAVKPQDMDRLLSDINKIIKKQKLFVSIVAGITMEFIKKRLPEQKVIRAMPNMGALTGKSLTAIVADNNVSKEELKQARFIFSRIGKVLVLDEEDRIDAITAISGSGPGYLAYIYNSISSFAQELGFDEELSWELVLRTVEATVSLMRKMKLSPGELIEKVASKGGTTEACLRKWNELKLDNIIKEGIRSAFIRAKELSK